MSKNKYKTLGVIPARYRSSRFEGKPLAMISGIPMLKRTFQCVLGAEGLTDLIVATEDDRIASFCKENNLPVIMTSPECQTGTARVAEVSTLRPEYDLYINIQGDEPVIDPKAIKQVIEGYDQFGDQYLAYNLYKEIDYQEEAESNTIIKVIVNENDELMYMSRLPIPYDQAKKKKVSYLKQVCVYAFTKEALRIFNSHPKTRNEFHEEVEILRFVELGYKVKMIETDVVSLSVDIPSDVQKVERFLAERVACQSISKQ